MCIIAEEVDKISQNLDVPEDWLISDLDKEILDLKCPEALLNITEDQVSIIHQLKLSIHLKHQFFLKKFFF